jgi:hypothetical protein
MIIVKIMYLGIDRTMDQIDSLLRIMIISGYDRQAITTTHPRHEALIYWIDKRDHEPSQDYHYHYHKSGDTSCKQESSSKISQTGDDNASSDDRLDEALVISQHQSLQLKHLISHPNHQIDHHRQPSKDQ